MKNMKKRTSIITLFALLFTLIFNISYAAGSFSISAGNKSLKVGGTTSLTITTSGCAGKFSISSSDSSVVSVSSGAVFVDGSDSVTLTAKKAGTATITVSASDVSDSSEKSVTGSKTISITVSGSNNNNNGDNSSNTDNKKTDDEKKSEPSFKSANDTMYATGDINVRKSYSSDSDKIGSLKAGDKITRTGIGDNGWSKVSFNGSTGYIKTSLLTSEEPKKSDDKALKSLSIEGVEIDPAFDPEITDYSVTFQDADKLDIKAEPSSDKATVEITGNEELKDGDNVIKITVTAEDGTTRLYSITATKQSANAATLSTLKVAGYTLNPTFSPDVKEYKLTILDSNVNKIDIIAKTNLENAKVEVLGNTDLKDGENIIQIKVTSPDESTTETYKIVATKNSSGTATGNTDSKSTNWILYAGVGIIALLIIAIIVVIIMSRRNAYYEDDEDYEDEDEEEEENEKAEDYSDLYGYSTKSEVKNVEPDASNNVEEATPKYEDGFNYNAFNSQNVYGDFNSKSEEQSGVKDVDYYSNKVSEMFDAPEAKENKTTDDAFGYLPKDEPAQEIKDEYTPLDNNWSDDNYRPRRSKGKHSK